MKPQTITSDSLIEKLETEEAISLVKSTFETQLKQALHLYKISAPMIVLKGTGINDDLNGIERAVRFPVKHLKEQPAEVVQSLAKWKRLRLAEYGIEPGTGIITDMRALRADEDLSPIHSIFVDQWDWEMVLTPEKRNIEFLKQTVEKIYGALYATEQVIAEKYPEKFAMLPEKITFIHAEELLQKYPDLSSKAREDKAARKFGAVFIIGIGGKLSHGEVHDGRAADYDDWTTETAPGFHGLNGDILVWNPELEKAFELSSMGIRVNAEVLDRQLELTGHQDRKELFYHKALLENKLPQSIGGGIGQSRLCMLLLKKHHIGEVQASIWPEDLRKSCKEQGIELL